MAGNNLKVNRNYGYDVLINNFEPFLRRFVVNEIFLIQYGKEWLKHIPKGILLELRTTKEVEPEKLSLNDFFEEITFLNLKDILVFSKHYQLAQPFFGKLNKEKFRNTMDELNILRRKIAHARSTFSELDFLKVVELVQLLCQGESAEEVRLYLKNEQYKKAKDIPLGFFEEFECPNNLPTETYDLDGGFVGRANEVRAIKKLIKSDLDRIITITGAGGVGKTAIALRMAYSFLEDSQNLFDAVIWFSAKTTKLTEEGIVQQTPGIVSSQQLIMDMLKVIDPEAVKTFVEGKVQLESFKTYLYKVFSSQKCLIVIDNLETILKDDVLVGFIKDIPRNSKVLITSRKGLGEIERRYPISDMPENDAILLFKIVAKERNRTDLLRLEEETIRRLVKRVRCYPLLIKWSIGQVCLGKEPDSAFSQIFAGESEIAKFSFNDVFSLLSDDSKLILYAMIIYGNKPVSNYVLTRLTNLTDDKFEDSIKELVLSSFVFQESRDTESGIATEYSMLTLTRGFVESQLDKDVKTKKILLTRHHDFSTQIEELEKAQSSYHQSLISIGVKTVEERIAFDYIKAAKNFISQGDMEAAETNFEKANKIAPKFSYALIQRSKFEFTRGHIPKALELANRAVQVDPENFHAWFSHGISLRKSNKIPESIKCLKKAKELNPEFLPIYNELGRSYTFNGDYDSAEIEFLEAQKEVKYPNYRHQVMTLQFLGDNYKRWSEAFGLRRDYPGQIDMLKKSFETFKKALEIAPRDKQLQEFYRHVCLELGVTLGSKKSFAEAKPYLEECITCRKIGVVLIIPNSEYIPAAFFYLALYSMDESPRNLKPIETYINEGLSNLPPSSKWYDKLKDLKKQILPDTPSDSEKKYGRIKYFNVVRKFGIIETADQSYLFFASGFRFHVPRELLGQLDGKAASFVLIESEKKKDQMIACDIEFL